jgi:hypothetical protein
MDAMRARSCVRLGAWSGLVGAAMIPMILSSCGGPAFRVTREPAVCSPDCDAAGIPFVNKRVRRRQVTDLAVVRLVLEANDADGRTHWTGSLDPRAAGGLRNAIAKAAEREIPRDAGSAVALIAAVHAEFPKAQSTVLSNRLAVDTVFDHESRYFVNVQRPIVGSSRADVELSPDLTLSKVTSEATDETLPTILSALPIEALLARVARGASNELAQLGGLALTGTEEKSKIRIYYELPADQSAIGAPLRWENAQAAGYEMELIPDALPAPPMKEEPPGSSIKFDGKVTLPKKNP